MISKIYYINLDRRLDRLQHINNELNKINYSGPIERIDAIDGKQLDIDILSDKLITVEGKNDALDKNKGMYFILTPGAIACALSHLNIYNKIIEEMPDDKYSLILEDDITINDNFIDKLNEYTSKMPQFDILFLGYHNLIPNEENENNIYGKPEKLWGLFGYLINRKGAIEFTKIFPLQYQIDTEMSKVFNNVNVFYLKDKLIISDESQNPNSKFGTDTQVREDFNNNNINNNNNNNINNNNNNNINNNNNNNHKNNNYKNYNNNNDNNDNNIYIIIILLIVIFILCTYC
jgi:GR25 family glycosyltransferase involved in LPS biosynthesis